MNDESRPSSRPVRWIRRLIWALLLLEVTYLLAGNVFLRTPWGPSLLGRRPEELQITWQDGWTPLPGLVHLKAINVRGRTPKLSWRVAADEAWVWMAPLDLVRRQFHVYRLQVGGLESQVHFDLKDPSGQPTIEGFESQPAPQPGSSKHRWRVDLDRIAVSSLKDLWIGALRYVPHDGEVCTVAGAMRLQVRGPFSIPWAQVELGAGHATVGDDVIGEVTRLAFDGRMDPFVPQEVKGIATLAFLSGTFAATTSGGSLGLMDYFFRGAPASVHGIGRLDTTLKLERGVLQPGTVLKLDDGSLRVAYLGWRGVGHGTLDGKVGQGGVTTLEVALDEVDIGFQDVGDGLVVGRGASLVATAQHFNLSDKRPDLRLEAKLPDSEVPDLSRFQAFLPKHAPVQLLAGSGRLSGQAVLLTTAPDSGTEAAESNTVSGAISGSVTVRGQKVKVRAQKETVLADVQLDVVVPSGDLASRELRIDGSRLQLTKVQVKGGKDWWADLKVPSGSVRLPQAASEAGGPGGVKIDAVEAQVDAKIVASLADSRPLLALVVERRASFRWFERLLTFENLSLDGEVRTVGDNVEFHDLVVRDGGKSKGVDRDLRILGQVRFSEAGYNALLRASLKVLIKKLAAGLLVRDGKVEDIDLYHSHEWYDARTKTFWRAPTPQRD